MGRLLGIAARAKKRGGMQLLTTARVTLAGGIENDFRGRPGKRQVTVITREGWQAACDDVGEALLWTTRRANLFVEGLRLNETQGKIIKIGNIRLLITQETEPCERMEEAFEGLEKALMDDWRGGVCCQVVAEGEIRVGDEVALVDGTP